MEGLTQKTATEIINKIQSMIDFDKLEFNNLEIEKIEIDVLAGATTYTKQHITDIVHGKVLGIALNITDEDVLAGATMSVSIDGQEVFPSGTEAKLLFASTAVPPNQKFYTYLKRDINQTRVDVAFTSNGFTSAYKAIFYLLCTKAS